MARIFQLKYTAIKNLNFFFFFFCYHEKKDIKIHESSLVIRKNEISGLKISFAVVIKDYLPRTTRDDGVSKRSEIRNGQCEDNISGISFFTANFSFEIAVDFLLVFDNRFPEGQASGFFAALAQCQHCFLLVLHEFTPPWIRYQIRSATDLQWRFPFLPGIRKTETFVAFEFVTFRSLLFFFFLLFYGGFSRKHLYYFLGLHPTVIFIYFLLYN